MRALTCAALCAVALAGCASTGQRLAEAAAEAAAAVARANAACAQAYVVLGASIAQAIDACGLTTREGVALSAALGRAAANAVRPAHPCWWGCPPPAVSPQREGIWYYPLRPSRVPPRR